MVLFHLVPKYLQGRLEVLTGGAWDVVTGRQDYKPVVQTYVARPDQLHHLRYRVREAAAGGENSAAADSESGEDDEAAHELVTTGSHPFFVPSLAQFVAAEDLEVGADLRLADGRLAEITAIELERAPEGSRGQP